jgi:hypothetical protein
MASWALNPPSHTSSTVAVHQLEVQLKVDLSQLHCMYLLPSALVSHCRTLTEPIQYMYQLRDGRELLPLTMTLGY